MSKIRGRHIQIVLYLLEQKYPVSASEILKELDINVNTFRKDISQIEGLLRENGLSLLNKPKMGRKS
jgi:transcriptional antiterminator